MLSQIIKMPLEVCLVVCTNQVFKWKWVCETCVCIASGSFHVPNHFVLGLVLIFRLLKRPYTCLQSEGLLTLSTADHFITSCASILHLCHICVTFIQVKSLRSIFPLLVGINHNVRCVCVLESWVKTPQIEWLNSRASFISNCSKTCKSHNSPIRTVQCPDYIKLT